MGAIGRGGGVWVEIEGFGETIVRRRLLRFAENLVLPIGAFEAAGTVLREEVEAQFESEGHHASGGWPELAESTKRKRGDDGHPILQVTQRLMESLTRKFDPDHIERPSPTSLTFGSTVAYGVFHQSSQPRTKIPYRPPIALNEAGKRRLVTAMQAEIIGSVRGGIRSAARPLA